MRYCLRKGYLSWRTCSKIFSIFYCPSHVRPHRTNPNKMTKEQQQQTFCNWQPNSMGVITIQDMWLPVFLHSLRHQRRLKRYNIFKKKNSQNLKCKASERCMYFSSSVLTSFSLYQPCKIWLGIGLEFLNLYPYLSVQQPAFPDHELYRE